MKRFFGWLLAGAGGVGAAWGGFYTLTGASSTQLGPIPVTALTGGLAGVAMLTIGLIWARD